MVSIFTCFMTTILYIYSFTEKTVFPNRCVSAWNDNGKIGNIDDKFAAGLYRTDFFPGLGWMMTKELWHELSVKWPKA